MATLYPGSIDGYAEIRVVMDGVSEILGRDHNDLRSAVVAIEQTLGISPQGAFGTVVARLDDAYSNLAAHVNGGPPQHPDTVITSAAKSGSPRSLTVGSVGSQLEELLGFINTNTQFIGLTDTPSSFSGAGGRSVRVNSGATALEFFQPTFLNLNDTPSVYVANRSVRVNSGATALELFSPTFTSLSDTPGSLGSVGQSIRVDGTGTALEFYTPAAGTFIGLSDTPGSFSGQANKVVKVNSGGTALIFETAGAGVTDFVDLSDTPSDLSGSSKNMLTVNAAGTAVITDIEAPTDFLSRAFDTFVVEGMSVSQGSGVDAVVAAGKIASNGRLISVPETTLSTPGVATTYYITATVDSSGAIQFIIDDDPAVAMGNLDADINTRVFLHSFTHNTSTWTAEQDLRRFGMLSNNKNFFTVGDIAKTDDGYGADFLTVKSAVEHIKLLNNAGVGKIAPKRLIMMENVSISSADEADIEIDIDGFEFDGAGRTITLSVDNALFKIEADNVKISRLRLLTSGLSSPTSACLVRAASSGTAISGLRVEDNTQEVSSGDAPPYFVLCGATSSVDTVSNSFFSNNYAEVDAGGITSPSGVSDILRSATVVDNVISQPTFSSTSSNGVQVSGASSRVDNNAILGGFNKAILLEDASEVSICGNTINGGTGTSSGDDTAYCDVGVYIDNSQHVLVDGNIIKGFISIGIVGGTNSIYSNNMLSNDYDVPSSGNSNGIVGGGASSSAIGNTFIETGGVNGNNVVFNCGSVIGNKFISCNSGVAGATIGINSNDTVISNNHITGASGGFFVAFFGAFNNCVISNNYFSGSSITTAVLSIKDETIIDGNFIEGATTGLDFSGATGDGKVVASNNYFHDITNPIDASGASSSMIVGNYIDGPSSSGGTNAIADVGSNSIVADNIFLNFDASGYVVEITGGSVSVVGNYLFNCDQGGIDLSGGSGLCVIANNVMKGVSSSSTIAINALTLDSVAYNNYIRSYGASSSIITSGSFGDITITNNTILESAATAVSAIVLPSSTQMLVAGNKIGEDGDQFPGIGIDVNSATFSVIANNYIRLDGSGSGEGGIVNVGANCSIVGNFIRGANGYAIEIVDSDCMISNNYIDGGNSPGIYLTDSDDCLVSNNYLHEMSSTGIEANASSTSCERNVVIGNLINNPTGFGILFSGFSSSNNDINSNYIYSPGNDAISVGATASNLDFISNNYIFSPGSDGVAFTSIVATRVYVFGNFINLTTAIGILVSSGAFDCNVVGNHIINAGTLGIDINGASGSSVCSNKVYSPASTGISIAGSNTLVVGNYVDDAGGDGITTETSDFMNISSNYVVDSSSIGINISSSTDSVVSSNTVINSGTSEIVGNTSTNDCIVSNNYISGTGVNVGIDLSSTDRCSVVGNIIKDIGSGINLGSSSRCVVNNNIIYDSNTNGINGAGSGFLVCSGNNVSTVGSSVAAYDFEVSIRAVLSGNYGTVSGSNSVVYELDFAEELVCTGNLGELTGSGLYAFDQGVGGDAMLTGNASIGTNNPTTGFPTIGVLRTGNGQFF